MGETVIRGILGCLLFVVLAAGAASDVLADVLAEHPASIPGLDASRVEEELGPAFTPANEQGQFRYLVEFARPGLLRSMSERVAGKGRRFNPRSPEVQAERAALRAYQAQQRQAIAGTLGRVPAVSHHFLAANNGLALWLDPQEVEAVARLPEVVSVTREPRYELATNAGPWFIGADTLWNGSNTPDGNTLRGEGMVLGVIDTGIDPDHPSFANDPACNQGQGAVPGKVLSALDCGSTDEDGLCNGPNPVDGHGHGTHVTSTAAGNFLNQNALPPPQPPGTSTEISGVAPCAHIRTYKGCPGSSCSGADIVAGLNSILLHGDVDVLNFSISGGREPWDDGDRIKLDLVDAGVLVAAAAGNTSGSVPVPTSQVNHRGPWVLSVAASTHDGAGSGGLLSASGPGTPADETRQIAATQGSESPGASEAVDFPIRHFDGQNPGAEGCDGEPAFPENFFENAAALIQRGICPFTEKIANAFEAGAELVIIRNNEPGGLIMDTTGQPAVPAYAIPQTPGDALQAFVSDHPDTATIDFEPIIGDVLADFSLRGPTPSPLDNLTKPDITAPGVSIYAAGVVPDGYSIRSGTSMASPHAAGSAVLLRQAHPDWTVSEVNSALMTTAERAGRKESLVIAWDPDDVGSGRVDLTKAALAGLVMDETVQNYLAADPDTGGDVRTLNTPSLRNMNCIGECSWTRTVRNTLEVPTQWTAGPGSGSGTKGAFEITVEPETFQFTGDPGETRELTITVTPLESLTGAVAFGEVVFTETGAQAPDQHLTVSVLGRAEQPIIALDLTHIETTLEEGETETRTLNISNPGELPLDWAVTEVSGTATNHQSSNVIAGDGSIDCNNQPGLIIQDTGTLDRAYAASSSSSDQVLFVDRFTPDLVPADFTDVCVAFVNLAGPSAQAEFEIVGFDDDGPDGAPGTELGALTVTAEGFPSSPGVPVWRSFDISTLEIAVTSGSVYIGARWPVTSPPTLFLGADESPVNPVGFAGGWQWTSPQDTWRPTEQVQAPYRAMVIRPAAQLGSLDCTLPDWVSVDPAAGTIEPDDTQAVDITFDAAGLENGTYTASLCLETNDPDRPLAIVPLILTASDLIFADSFEAGAAP